MLTLDKEHDKPGRSPLFLKDKEKNIQLERGTEPNGQS